MLIEKHDVDYYTAVYSSNIKKFSELFVELHGSRNEYFTPTDRALLTYELLSRANFDDHPEEKLHAHSIGKNPTESDDVYFILYLDKKGRQQNKYIEERGIQKMKGLSKYTHELF